MRILHVINNGSTCGGAERLTAGLVAAQRAAGHRVHVLAGDRAGSGEWFADSTWPVPVSRGPARIRDFYWNGGARRALREVLARWRPDVVHLHTIGLLSAGALPSLGDLPTVMTVHGPEHFVRGTVRFSLPARYYRDADPVRGRLSTRGVAAYAWAELVTAGAMRYVLRRYVDVFTAPSPYLAALVERSLGPTRLIRNGLDPEFRAAARSGRSSGTDRGPGGHRLVAAGRLDESKGIQVLVSAMPDILARHPGTRLTVVGSGAIRERLRHQAVRLGVEPAVTLTGWQSPADLAVTLGRSDVAVVPSIWPEAFGLAALEALAAGCAVVASGVGGLPDLIRHERTGLLVPPGDPVALAGAVLRLLDDPPLRARLADRGGRLADELTMSGYAEAMLASYRDAIARRGAGPVGAGPVRAGREPGRTRPWYRPSSRGSGAGPAPAGGEPRAARR